MKIVGVGIEDLGTKSVLVTAALTGVKFDFEVAEGTCCASAAKKNAFSELKHAVTIVLDKNLGTFCGHITICRYLLDTGLSCPRDEKALFERSDTSSWLEFFNERLDVASRCKEFVVADSKSDSPVSKCLRAIDSYLLTKTFLVGESLTAADLVCVVSVNHLLGLKKLDEKFLEELTNLSRFARTVKSSDPYLKFVKMVETYKATGKLFEVVKEAPKAKPKNPFDELPPSKFSLDAWKKLFSNCKDDLYKGVMPWLWENHDPEGYTFYFMKYNKLEDECTSQIYTSNMLSGFLQRFENELRHYSFAVLNVMGSGKSFDIMGVWLIRGHQIPELIQSHPSYEFNEFTKLDVTKESDRKLVADYFCAEEQIDGVPIADSKVWK